MRNRIKILSIALLVALAIASSAIAQRPRNPNDSTSTTTTTLPPAPPTVKAKYEGGVFGYNRKIDGTITFDDQGKRLLFRNKEQQELFSIPYASVMSAFADTQSRRPTAATVIGSASIYTLPALLFKKKYRYLTLQYNDPDTRVSGLTSFKIDGKEMLASVLNTLAGKAGLTPRGEIFIRRKEPATNANVQ